MPTYFQKPENALKRANEFIDVGKKERALESLYDVIKSKKHRTWQVTHEPIMEQYLELCVELRKSNVAKEGLYQYKIICQAVNINSLVNVVRKYIGMAEEKTENARLQSKASVLDVDDLDAPESPESLLLKVVSGDDTQARADRTILMPWVKFLWESYRQCLELLRNNTRVEALYQDIAQQAFRFCLKYQRNTEFRKLCDNLRNHLSMVHRHQHPQTAINLNNPESQAMHLETRLAQLDSAINMELWQEAFKAVEDIHSLITLSKKSPKPSLMANYYQKLSLVFWKSNSPVFHASSLHRLFSLQRDQRKNITQAELQKMAGQVVCATLAIPIQAAKNTIDKVLELDETTLKKDRHLATLLMLNNPPTRQGLLADLVKNNVLSYLSPELQDLYSHLEINYHPLSLYTKLKPSMDYIMAHDNLAQYSESLEDVTIARLVKQVSQVYETIKFSRLISLLPFATNHRLERVIVCIAKTLEMQIRVDHRSESITFGTDLLVSQREDVAEGPFIQAMPSETVRNQLTVMAKALRKAIDTIEPRQNKAEHIKMKDQIVNCYRNSAKKEHSRLLQRRQIIEERKEQLEHFNTRKEEQEVKIEEEKRKKVEQAERLRREAEAEQREKQRLIDETETIRRRHAQDKMKELKQSEIGAKVLKTMDESAFEGMTVEDIMEKQVEQLEKDRKVLIEKLKAQEKKVDYMLRAKRLVEIPLLQADYETTCVEKREAWEKQEAERVENLKTEKIAAESTNERLTRMTEDKDVFREQLRDSRKSTFKDKVAEFDKKLAEERKKRLADRKKKRKEERRMNWLREKEEAEQRKRDEQMKREREEAEEEQAKLEREEAEAEEAEKEAALAAVRETVARQEPRDGESGGGSGGKWRPTAHTGGWRDRVQAQHAAWTGDRDVERKTSDPDRGPASWRSPAAPAETSLPTRDWRDDRGPSDRGPSDRGPSDRRPDDRGMGRQEDRGMGGMGRADDRGMGRSDDPGMGRSDDQGMGRMDDRGMSRGDDRGISRPDDKQPWRPAERRDDRASEDRPPAKSWRDDAPPKSDERPNAWGRPAPPRDDRPPLRDERPPQRDERQPPPRDDRQPPPRDDREPPPRDTRPPPPRDERPPPPRDERTPPRDERSPVKRDDAPPQAWRPANRDSPLNRDDRGPRDETPRAWSSAAREDRAYPARDDRKDDRLPQRDTMDGRGMRDDRGARDQRGPERMPDDRGTRDTRGPARMEDDRGMRGPDRGPRDDRPPDRGQYRDDRGPDRDDRRPAQPSSWRDNRDSRDNRDPPREDRWRRDDPPKSEDRWRRDDRPSDDRSSRDGPPARDAPPQRDEPRRDGPWRRDEPPREEPRRDAGPWRRDGPTSQAPPRGDERRDDRRPPPSDTRDGWRQRQEARGGPAPDSRPPPRDGGRDDWRRGDTRGGDTRGDPRDNRGDTRGDSRTPQKEPRREPPPPKAGPEVDDEGWTTVRH